MESREETVAVPGGVLQTCTSGTDGPPIVLLHGASFLGITSEDINGLTRCLQEGATVHRYARRGWHGSVSAGPFSLEADVEDLEALRCHWGYDRLTLLGISWGGFLAMAYAGRYPERVAALVLVDTVGPLNNGWLDEVMAVLRANSDKLGPMPLESQFALVTNAATPLDRVGPSQWFLIRFGKQYLGIEEATHGSNHRQLQLIKDWDFQTIPASREQELVGLHVAYESGEVAERLSRLTAPVLVIQGDRVGLPVPAVVELRALLPQATVVEHPQPALARVEFPFDVPGHGQSCEWFRTTVLEWLAGSVPR